MAWYDPIKRGTEEFVETLTEGWDRLRKVGGSALTRFTRSGDGDGDGDDPAAGEPAAHESWGLLSGEVSELEKEIVVRLEVPGMNREDFSISVERGYLVVRGEKRFEREHSSAQYHEFETAYGSFQRALPLPCEVNEERATAQYERGVLSIRLPRAAATRSRNIPIRE